MAFNLGSALASPLTKAVAPKPAPVVAPKVTTPAPAPKSVGSSLGNNALSTATNAYKAPTSVGPSLANNAVSNATSAYKAPVSSGGSSGGGGGNSSNSTLNNILKSVTGGINSVSNGISSAYDALNEGYNGANMGASVANYNQDSYKGTPGTTSFSYPGALGSAQGLTLEGLQKQQQTMAAKDRISNQDDINQQLETLNAQKAELIKNKQAAAQAAVGNAVVGTKDDTFGALPDGLPSDVPALPADQPVDQPLPPKEDNYESDPEVKAIEDQLTALNEKLGQYQAPSEEERQYDEQLRQLMASKAMGLQEVSEQPIATGFITGQQKAIEGRVANQAMPLQNQLAALQAQRQAAADVVKSKVGLLSDKVGRVNEFGKEKRQNDSSVLKAQQAAEAAASKPFTVGNGASAYVYNPKTGKYEVVANNPKTFAPVVPKTVAPTAPPVIKATQAGIPSTGLAASLASPLSKLMAPTTFSTAHAKTTSTTTKRKA